MITAKDIAQTLVTLVTKHDYTPEQALGAFSTFVATKKLEYSPQAVLRALTQMERAHAHTRELAIESPYPLSDTLQQAIRDFVGADKDVAVAVSENKELIGGFVARFNNNVYDASIEHSLTTFTRSLHMHAH